MSRNRRRLAQIWVLDEGGYVIHIPPPRTVRCGVISEDGVWKQLFYKTHQGALNKLKKLGEV